MPIFKFLIVVMQLQSENYFRRLMIYYLSHEACHSRIETVDNLILLTRKHMVITIQIICKIRSQQCFNCKHYKHLIIQTTKHI